VGSQDNRGAPAGSRQRLGDVVVTYLRDNRAGSSGNQAPKIGCLNRPTIGGYASAQDLSAEGLEQTPMSLLVPLLEFNPEWSGHHKCRRDDIEQFQKVKRSFRRQEFSVTIVPCLHLSGCHLWLERPYYVGSPEPARLQLC
jgi:hypothetical protein